MTRDDIIRLAREAGIDAERDTLCRNEGWVEPMVKFAALVIGNHQPRSSMSWQEGYEIGVATEREACAKVCENGTFLHDFSPEAVYSRACARAIRARGQV
jgi:hypothetical protein